MTNVVPYQPKAVTAAGMLLPQSIEQAWELADRMAQARMMPPHLKDSPSDCLRVIMKATSWQIDPWTVAEHTSFVNGRECMSAQLIHAIINRMAPIDGRLSIQIEGDGNDVRVRVGAAIINDQYREKLSPSLANAQRGSSPLWKTDPAQQLAYQTIRSWARLYVPDVIMGLYTPDEISGAGVDDIVSSDVRSTEAVDAATGEVRTDPLLDNLIAQTDKDAAALGKPAEVQAADGGNERADAASRPFSSDAQTVAGVRSYLKDLMSEFMVHSADPQAAAKLLSQHKKDLSSIKEKASAGGTKYPDIAGNVVSILDFADQIINQNKEPDQADLLRGA